MPDYFVCYEYEPLHWRHIYNNSESSATWLGADSDDACGLAAIQQGASGKYVAFDVAGVHANEVVVALAADASNVSFP